MIVEGLRKARTMSWQDWGLLLEAARVVLVIEIALRVLPFNTFLARLEAVGTSHAPPTSRVACADAVRRAYRLLPFGRTCLKESLVLFRLLRRRGMKVQFRLGVRKEGNLLAAHVEEITTETFRLLRPTWSEPADRDKLRADAKTRIVKIQEGLFNQR